MSVDVPASGATVFPSFRVDGWALDLAAASGTGVDTVHIWAFPNFAAPAVFLGVAPYGAARPDVGAYFGSQYTNSAYGLAVSGLAPGSYTIVAYAHSTVTGTFNNSTVFTVNVQGAAPLMSLDTPTAGSVVSRPFLVAGWAFDRAAPAGTGVDTVHVWAYPASGGAPVFLGVARYGDARPDVGAAFGMRFTNSSFGLTASSLAPGIYDLVVYAHSTVTGTFNNTRVIRITVN
jgi:hypothetical protein